MSNSQSGIYLFNLIMCEFFPRQGAVGVSPFSAFTSAKVYTTPKTREIFQPTHFYSQINILVANKQIFKEPWKYLLFSIAKLNYKSVMELWSSDIKNAGRDLEFLIPPKCSWKANTGGFFNVLQAHRWIFFLTLSIKFYTSVHVIRYKCIYTFLFMSIFNLLLNYKSILEFIGTKARH